SSSAGTRRTAARGSRSSTTRALQAASREGGATMKHGNGTSSWFVGAVTLVVVVFGARVAFSGKVSDTGSTPPVNTGPSPMPSSMGCDNAPNFELAQKLITGVIEAKRWTAKDHERIAPLFYGLHTDQK